MTTADRDVQVQPVAAPYLLTPAPGGGRLGVGVAVTGDADLAVVEVTATGSWSPEFGDQVAAALRLCLAGPSASIVIDLHDLGDPRGVSLPFWLALWQQARFAVVPVRVTFCLPATTELSRRIRNLQGPQPTVFASVADARAAIAGRTPNTDSLRASLEPLPMSVRAARALAVRACHTWQMEELLPDTCLIVSELAANAVEHAGTDLIVTVTRSGTRLHVVIHDGTGAFPGPGELRPAGVPAPLHERGRGLQLVGTIAAAWGAMPARHGKVVWATVT